MEEYGREQYYRAVQVLRICAMRLCRSTLEWYPVGIVWIIPGEKIHTRSITIGHDEETRFTRIMNETVSLVHG